MTISEYLTALSNVVAVLGDLPGFVEPIDVSISFGETKLLLRWDDFSRMFVQAEYSRDSTHERLRTVSRGIQWFSCRRLDESGPCVVVLPVAPAAHAACDLILLEDDGE